MIRNADYVWSKLSNTEFAKKAQVGVDITLKNLHRMDTNDYVRIPSDVVGDEQKKNVILGPCPTLPMFGTSWFLLVPGAYSITFNEGLEVLANDETAYIIQRSTFNRNGCRIQGSVFDPGFFTPRLGATLYTTFPMQIALNARVAQVQIFQNEPVSQESLYAGQYQGKV